MIVSLPPEFEIGAGQTLTFLIDGTAMGSWVWSGTRWLPVPDSFIPKGAG